MKKIINHIAKKLKALRSEYNLSLDKVSEMTGVSKAMLGQIERMESIPTISILWKIATGLNVSFSYFLKDKAAERRYSKSGIKKLKSKQATILASSLFPLDSKLGFEIFSIELLPHSLHRSEPHHPGVVEHVLVLSGKLQLLLNNDLIELQKGEGLRFDADQPHIYQNKTSSKVKFYNIIYYPKRFRNFVK